MDSIIKLDEAVENKERKFGASTKYYPCKIVFEDGYEVDALFTRNQISVAVNRGSKNPEDIPESFWDKLFG